LTQPILSLTRNLSIQPAVLSRLLGALAMAALVVAVTLLPAHAVPCPLNSPASAIQHIIYLQFDNVHFTRDNPNVPSDLEQMPTLLNFLENNGTLDTNHHTPLISHTANDILTTLTGVYPDRHGVPIANSFRYFNPDGTTNTGVAFAYWTDPLFDPSTFTPSDTFFNMITRGQKNTPAPWVTYTRAGCNFGAAGSANVVLENIATDIPTVFGANSPQAAEVASNPNQATADFVGIGIHCAAGDALCSPANGGSPDPLPNEPGGYVGYNALFGHAYVAPQISPSGPLTDLNGNVIKNTINGDIGFPGFDGMLAPVSLAYVAAMQEHGIRVTYGYLSDAHDAHPSGPAYGPGQAGYVAQLASYDAAFAAFFARLAADGIDKSNTLFIVTSDEGDHFVGGAPSPAGCDGVTTPCTYTQIGELNVNLAGLLATEFNVKSPFTVHSDSAPTIYLTGHLKPYDPVTRLFEHSVASVTAVNPITGNTDFITQFLADPVEQKALHMVTTDPNRTPTFIQFADPNYFLFAGSTNCNSPCLTEPPSFAWNHGDVQSEITTTWVGLVGPGVRNKGLDSSVWTDETDVRPTILLLTGLKDDYVSDGRVIAEDIAVSPLPKGLTDLPDFLALAAAYKQINAPLGPFGTNSLTAVTHGIESVSAGDATYKSIDQQISQLTGQRNQLAAQMIAILNKAEFSGVPVDPTTANNLITQANNLLAQMAALAGQ
jgi:hypothetical protein